MQSTPVTLVTPAKEPVFENSAEMLCHEAENEDYPLLEVVAPKTARIARSAQFFHLICPHACKFEPFFRRPMSIHNIDQHKGRILLVGARVFFMERYLIKSGKFRWIWKTYSAQLTLRSKPTS